MRAIVLILSATVLAGIAWLTLGPVHVRPQFGHPVLERFAPHLVLGALLALAAPRRPTSVLTAAALLAVGLEAAQALIPDRDPRFLDAIEKLAGAWCGAGCVLVAKIWPQA